MDPILSRLIKRTNDDVSKASKYNAKKIIFSIVLPFAGPVDNLITHSTIVNYDSRVVV